MQQPQEDSRIDKKKVLSVLDKLDKNLRGIQRKIKIYCIGGTALTFSNIRNNSKDIDFIVSREDFRALSGHVADIEYKEKIRIDIFLDGELPDYQYKGYTKNSRPLNIHFENLELYVLDEIDLLLTKILSGRPEDLLDIKKMGVSKEILRKDKLIQRYQEIKIDQEKEGIIRKKFEDFIKKFYGS